MNHLKINLDLYSISLASYNLEFVEEDVIKSITQRKYSDGSLYAIFTFLNYNPNVNKTNLQALEWCQDLVNKLQKNLDGQMSNELKDLYIKILYYSFLMHRDRCEDVECKEFYEIYNFLEQDNVYDNSSSNWFFIERLRLDWIFIMIHRADLSKYNEQLKKHIAIAKQNQQQFKQVQHQLDESALSIN